ncbi:MAG: Translation initiation factor IF-2 [Candidatus Roizmanbacteria bacterium GW2011_GWA2_34_18]|uniref:Translation initiation factor IF-2 n=1 Tax=Candidatus Roizmanbacteria bacterium GW2011_GWA2_34_18 TaxID=1618477 RepID=A0A0G0E119_9BACT|nr:MAG: Translation initiation factor IF-2 [Candidatus Roizmanbacteria bacterium GW2011_GWA2_34_18]
MNQSRPPIVAILGHVDHGKTTLLDYIRKSNITDREYGGITQKIGAYEITTEFKEYKTNKITFIDTPGHEAFTKLRARGANIADIALLLIDGKDSVMPQTVESISHIKAAKIPFIVVINKIDLPETNPEKVKNDLLKYEVMTEAKGGEVPVALVSAKTGKGINELLETILFIASDLKLNYDEKNPALAYIIETKKDRRGIISSAIIKDGTIKITDTLFVNDQKIKVKSLINDLGKSVTQVLPSSPFEILGFNDMPEVGSLITQQPVSKTSTTTDPLQSTASVPLTLEDVLKVPVVEKKLAAIIKADSQGSVEALKNSLKDNINLNIILLTVGEINKSDIFLAKATKSIIIGYTVKTSAEAEDLAKQEKVIIKSYQIIYELLDELNEVANLIKEKEEKEKNLKGEARIIANFIIEREKIFGVLVIKGKINLGDQLECFRKNKLIGKTKLVSLKIRAKIVSEVKKGQEAGMIFGPPLDFLVGDVVKSIL